MVTCQSDQSLPKTRQIWMQCPERMDEIHCLYLLLFREDLDSQCKRLEMVLNTLLTLHSPFQQLSDHL